MLKHFEYVQECCTITTTDGIKSFYFPLYTCAIRKARLESLDLSVRAYNTLKRGGITTLDALLTCPIGDLMTIKNLGRKSLVEIVEKLSLMMFHR